MQPPKEAGRYRLERTGTSQSPASSLTWAGELNVQQAAAVLAPCGPVLVLAGAGSGKTRVITYRVAYLIREKRVAPQQIMLATFTNKAARAMLERCEEVAGPAARQVTGGTFHHIANLLLRRYAKTVGYEPNFTILDEADSRSVMKLCRGEAGIEKRDKAFPSDRLLCNIASAIVNTNTDLDTLLARRYAHLYEQRDAIERVLIDYHLRKQASNQMDFDDLLVNLYKLLTNPEQRGVRAALARRFQHILVDEYQDVNHIQAAIVRELYKGVPEGELLPVARTSVREQDGSGAEAPATDLTGWDWEDDGNLAPPLPAHPEGSGEHRVAAAVEEISGTESATPQGKEWLPVEDGGCGGPPHQDDRSLFVVGDDAQSIYRFRGADYTQIRGFPQSFPGAHVFKLETNYRSVPEVLSLANGVLEEADPMFKKELLAVRSSCDTRPLLLACHDAEEQAEFVAEQILKLREDLGLDYDDIAVLYRAHSNRLEAELQLTQRGIPFIVRGGLRFFEQAHIKDLLSYLVVLANRRDELAWQRMLGMCNRVGPKTIAGVLTDIRKATDSEGGPLGRFTGNGIADKQRGQAKSSLKELQGFLRGLEAQAEQLPAAELLKKVLDERYAEYLQLKYENSHERLQDLEQLIVFSSRFDTLTGFLAEVGLAGSFAGAHFTGPHEMGDPEEGAVTLSTIHQAKGLEWTAVFIIHVQDDVLPHRMTRDDAEQEDEERRLLYVAVTRAKEILFMSYPQVVQTRDFQRLIQRPSRFLEGLPGECYDLATLEWGGE